MSIDIKNFLLSSADPEYKTFQAALIPTVDPKRIIGVRVPDLRTLAKRIRGTDEARAFLAELPHTYYDEDNLHAFLIEQIRGFDDCVMLIERFLPYVDNWATCDSMSPKALSAAPDRLLKKIEEWIASSHVYTVRYGIVTLMKHFLDERFSGDILSLVAGIQSEDYYVRMAVAWFFATALAKQYASTIPYLENSVLDKWTHNKAIQKAQESLRLDKKQKEYLKTLKLN